MRILDVCPRTGLHRGGAATRLGNILRHLGERHDVRRFGQPRLGDLRAPDREHQCRVLRSRSAAALAEVGERTWVAAPVLAGAALRLARPAELRGLVQWADATLVEFPWQMGHVARLDPRGPLVLASHNVEAQKFASYADAAGARVTRAPWLRYIEGMERAAVRRADLIVAVKEGDSDEFVDRYGADPARIVVAPNGADVEGLTPADGPRRTAARRGFALGDGPVAVYVAANAPPNVRGLDRVLAMADATPEVTFLVVGTVHRRRRERNVVFTGPIDEIAPAFDAADVALCPVEFGGGTKVKLLESLSAGLPTIAFEESLLGLELRHGEHVLLAERTTESLVSALRRLVADRALAARLGQAGRRRIVERHDWRASAAIVEAALAGLVPAARRRAVAPPRRATRARIG